MQKDESGILKKYVEQFKLSDSRIEKEAIVTNILYFITGAKDVASNSRGSQIDAKILNGKLKSLWVKALLELKAQILLIQQHLY